MNYLKICLIILVCLFQLKISAEISLSPSMQMRLFTEEEYLAKDSSDSQILASLKEYHSTAEFTQSLTEYRLYPEYYFAKRIVKLEELLDVIAHTEINEINSQLKDQIHHKINYLKNLLPTVRDPRSNKKEVFEDKILKLIPVSDLFWFEILDPLHRFSWETQIYLNRWKMSKIPNYFIYLETVEYHALLNRYTPFKKHVKYYTEEERQSHKLHFSNGLIYLNNKIFDTEKQPTVPYGFGSCIYVLGPDNEFYVNKYEWSTHHSGEFAGGSIEGAGEIVAREGKIISISCSSGHYQPQTKEFLHTLEILEQKMGNLNGIEALNFVFDKVGTLMVLATFDAHEYLHNNGCGIAKEPLFGWTPLHIAVVEENTTLASSVLTNENSNTLGVKNYTPLHLASQCGNIEWVKLLLEFEAHKLFQTEEGNTALHFACINGRDEIISLLYADECELLKQKNANGETPLLSAFKSCNNDTIKFLLQKGSDIDIEDQFGNNPFHNAVCNEKLDVIAFLLKSEIKDKISQPNKLGKTPFLSASECGDITIIKFLMDLGADYKQTDTNGNTALHYAAMNGNNETFRYLSDLGGLEYVLQRNVLGETALHLGAAILRFETLKTFFDSNVEIDLLDNLGNTPLYHALKAEYDNQNAKNVCGFIELGANPHLINSEGLSAIHIAAKTGCFIRMFALLTYSDDFYLADYQGNSAIHYLIMNDNVWMLEHMKTYIDEKILNLKNNEGKTPVDLAESSEDDQIREIIQRCQKGPKKKERPLKGRQIADFAVNDLLQPYKPIAMR